MIPKRQLKSASKYWTNVTPTGCQRLRCWKLRTSDAWGQDSTASLHDLRIRSELGRMSEVRQDWHLTQVDGLKKEGSMPLHGIEVQSSVPWHTRTLEPAEHPYMPLQSSAPAGLALWLFCLLIPEFVCYNQCKEQRVWWCCCDCKDVASLFYLCYLTSAGHRWLPIPNGLRGWSFITRNDSARSRADPRLAWSTECLQAEKSDPNGPR